MRFRLNDEIRKKIWVNIIIIAAGIGIFFAFYKFSIILKLVKKLISLTAPFILGFAFAFLLNKPMQWIEGQLLKSVPLKRQTKRYIAAIISVIFGVCVVLFFLGLLIPPLIESIVSLVQAFPGYVEDFEKFLLAFIEENAIDTEAVSVFIENNDFFTKLTDLVTQALPKMIVYTYQFGSTLLDVVLGIMSCLYMLIDKERLLRYVKKFNYAIFPTEVSEFFHFFALASGDIFNNFIVGKAIDSLIIGIICYICLLIFGFPYALLLSVIIGITNMIPVFGPFIGAIPGAVILLLIHPIWALYFILFIFVLQQFDGNILGPLILGDKLGLPSIGILFAVVVGGGLFGIIGMFVGVPCLAVIYTALRGFVNYRLMEKDIDIENVL